MSLIEALKILDALAAASTLTRREHEIAVQAVQLLEDLIKNHQRQLED